MSLRDVDISRYNYFSFKYLKFSTSLDSSFFFFFRIEIDFIIFFSLFYFNIFLYLAIERERAIRKRIINSISLEIDDSRDIDNIRDKILIKKSRKISLKFLALNLEIEIKLIITLLLYSF